MQGRLSAGPTAFQSATCGADGGSDRPCGADPCPFQGEGRRCVEVSRRLWQRALVGLAVLVAVFPLHLRPVLADHHEEECEEDPDCEVLVVTAPRLSSVAGGGDAGAGSYGESDVPAAPPDPEAGGAAVPATISCQGFVDEVKSIHADCVGRAETAYRACIFRMNLSLTDHLDRGIETVRCLAERADAVAVCDSDKERSLEALPSECE